MAASHGIIKISGEVMVCTQLYTCFDPKRTPIIDLAGYFIQELRKLDISNTH